MRQVESRGDDRAVGDHGRSRGPYQISRLYWADGGGDPRRYDRDVWSAETSRRVVVGYWRRYCPAALEAGDLETLARVHNGGPHGAAKVATLEYWRRLLDVEVLP
jgi:predicted chitinase